MVECTVIRGIQAIKITVASIFMPPTSKKLKGHIGLGLSVRAVRAVGE